MNCVSNHKKGRSLICWFQGWWSLIGGRGGEKEVLRTIVLYTCVWLGGKEHFTKMNSILLLPWGNPRDFVRGKGGNNSRNRQKTALWAISSCSWRQGGDVWGESVRGWEAGGSRRENGELKRSQIIGFEAKTEIWANRQGRGEMSMSIAANDYEVYMTENWTMRVSEMSFLVYSIFLANDWRMWI